MNMESMLLLRVKYCTFCVVQWFSHSRLPTCFEAS